MLILNRVSLFGNTACTSAHSGKHWNALAGKVDTALTYNIGELGLLWKKRCQNAS